MLLSNFIDPSRLISVEQQQTESQKNLKVLCLAIIKEYKPHMNGVNIHDQLKSTYLPALLMSFLQSHGFSFCQCPHHLQKE